MLGRLWNHIQTNFVELIEWAKCGESPMSVVPTVLWAVGTVFLAQRILTALFRRFLFRRIPLWEVILQYLLFLWLVIYSLHFWMMMVKLIKFLVNYCYEDEERAYLDDPESSKKVIKQWVIWMMALLPLAYYLKTRPRPENSPLMIWITTSPWQRREMGPYGYYLNRPLSALQSSTNLSIRKQVLTMRRAFSDSKVIIKETVKKKRYSKSV